MPKTRPLCRVDGCTNLAQMKRPCSNGGHHYHTICAGCRRRNWRKKYPAEGGNKEGGKGNKDESICPECGDVYKTGEDTRVDTGMKCGKCAYGIN